MLKREYKRKIRESIENEIGFQENVEFTLFKYAYMLDLSSRELKIIESMDGEFGSSKSWKKYIVKTYRTKEKRQILREYAEIKKIEYSVYEEYNSEMMMAMLVALLVLLIQTIISLLDKVEFAGAAIQAVIVVMGIFSLISLFFVVSILLFATYILTRAMKKRKYKKKFYSEIIKVLK